MRAGVSNSLTGSAGLDTDAGDRKRWAPAVLAFAKGGILEGFNAPDLRFVLSRLTALVEAGQLEGDGDVSTLDGHSQSRVRHPT